MLIIGWTILGPILFVSGCFIVSALIVGILYGFWKIIETPLHALDNWMGSRWQQLKVEIKIHIFSLIFQSVKPQE